MNFKKYLKNIEKKFVEQKPTRKIKPDTKITEEKKILGFIDSDKDPYDYLKRYIKETKYKDWFNRIYPNHTIYDAVGLSADDYVKMKRKLVPEPKQTVDTEQSPKLNKPKHKQNINLKSDEEPNNPFNDFIDERELISHNAFGDKEMKIKILEISDEIGQTAWKFGDRVKINKILIFISLSPNALWLINSRSSMKSLKLILDPSSDFRFMFCLCSGLLNFGDCSVSMVCSVSGINFLFILT